jgi:hypothetical protein
MAGQGISTPRCFVTRNDDPNNAFPATAPRLTMISGSSSDSSAVSQGLQAAISPASGVWWMRRLPGAGCLNLKCFTAFVTYASPRSMPASTRALSSSRPAGPTNGAPCLSS